MYIVHAEHGKAICLGREGENLARQVVFDVVAEWQELYGEGEVQLIAQRMGDTEPYPCVVEVDGANAVWTITNADTAKPGNYGKCELQYYVGEQIVKSETWQTIVLDAMDEPGENVSDPEQNWYHKMLEQIAAADWNQNDPTQPDYVKNRTHYKGEEWVEIIPETTGEKRTVLYDPFKLVYGETYRVTYNGVEYECVCKYVYSSTGSPEEMLGDMFGKTYPFSLMTHSENMYAGSYGYMDAEDGSTEVTFRVEHYEEVIRTIDKDFLPKIEHGDLPEGVPWVNGNTVVPLDNRCLQLAWLPIYTNEEFSFGGEQTVTNGTAYLGLTSAMVYHGMPIIGYIDGVRYETTIEATDSGFIFYLSTAVGNIIYGRVSVEAVGVTVSSKTGEFTVDLRGYVPNRMPGGFLPYLYSPDGTAFKLTVANDGTLGTVEVTE